MNINKLVKDIHNNAKKKGFWKNKREFGTLLMLVVSELAEALEADRKPAFVHHLSEKEYKQMKTLLSNHKKLSDKEFKEIYQTVARGTISEELADAIIRLLDICGGYKIDIALNIELKMRYNSLRSKMHGKNY